MGQEKSYQEKILIFLRFKKRWGLRRSEEGGELFVMKNNCNLLQLFVIKLQLRAIKSQF